MTVIRNLALTLLCLGLLGACDNDGDHVPPPQALTDDAVGVYCGMILTEHAGPKGQVFEKGRDAPLWFTAVRDAIAYTRLPGEGQSTVAIYVQDMARAESWEKPQPDGIWITAETAFYVVGSEMRGGMGMPETVPFGTIEAAQAFAAKHGGQVMRFEEIPDSVLLPGDNENSDTIADKPSGEGAPK
ncbi:MAG: nitrous oxide reductase accessory protein NosL [Sneathiella sp.]|nr:nitrous oxide reductase accessory protein NosL [Sneathiella sp.]